MTVGQSVRNRRRDMRLSQKELCSRLGISPALLSLIENDKRDPSWELVRRLVKLFGIDVIIDGLDWRRDDTWN